MNREENILSQRQRVEYTARNLARKIGRPDLRVDLEQVGWCGAIQAVDRYDTSRSNLALSTVTRYRIKGAMIDWMRTGACDPQIRKQACKGTPRFDGMPDVHVFTAGLFNLDDFYCRSRYVPLRKRKSLAFATSGVFIAKGV